jgi:hypothetical protein
MAQPLGISVFRLETAIRALRRQGYAFPVRGGHHRRTIGGEELRRVRRAYKQHTPSTRLSERQKTVYRLLCAMERPVLSRTLTEMYHALGHDVRAHAFASALRELRAKGLVERARVAGDETIPSAQRYRWFVPLESEAPRESLTLADAEREVELANLIREQEDDAERGHWAKADGTLSLDAPIGEGGTLHDVLRTRR